jgi:IS1 family transposase
LDEKWSFVAKKQAGCDLEDAADHEKGDCWDHVAFDPEHRLVLDVEFGKRSGTRVKALLERVKTRLRGRVPRLVTTDEFAAYGTLLPRVWPEAGEPRRPDGRRARRARTCNPPAQPKPDPALNYATVCKQHEGGRVTSVRTRVVFGTEASVAEALAASKASTAVNTSFLERHNATDRHRNARKARRTYRFSKDWQVHEAVGRFTLFTYNFCHAVRTLRQRIRSGERSRGGGGGGGRGNARVAPRYRRRTPAMAAGLADHVWTLAEWLARPVVGLAT